MQKKHIMCIGVNNCIVIIINLQQNLKTIHSNKQIKQTKQKLKQKKGQCGSKVSNIWQMLFEDSNEMTAVTNYSETYLTNFNTYNPKYSFFFGNRKNRK